MPDLLMTIDYLGTFVFAISGILVGVERKFDMFGVFILGFVTALGGGTLRDMMIGSTPVGWMTDYFYILIVLLAMPISYFGKAYIIKWKRSIFLFDTMGIGLFTILGLEKTLAMNLPVIVAVMMGVVSAVFGGVIRDVLSGKTPIIFHKEIYAFACLVGALAYLGLQEIMHVTLATYISILVVIIVRVLGIKRKWLISFNP